MQMRDLLYDQADRYRWLSFKFLTQPSDTAQEHREIMEAVLERKEETSIRLLRDHLAKTVEIVMKAGQDVF